MFNGGEGVMNADVYNYYKKIKSTIHTDAKKAKYMLLFYKDKYKEIIRYIIEEWKNLEYIEKHFFMEHLSEEDIKILLSYLGPEIREERIDLKEKIHAKVNPLKKDEDVTNKNKIDTFFEKYEKTIQMLGKIFSEYQHPEGKKVDAQAIKNWLIQFTTPERMRLALILLENVVFINREKMIEMFNHYWEHFIANDEKNKVILTNLGGPYDSSYLVSYFLGDIGMKKQIPSTDLRAIIEREDPAEKIILFVDDNIGSGKQALDIFKELLGIENKELKERHVPPLNPKQVDKLKKFKLRLFTFVGFEEGKRKLLIELRNLGLNVEDIYSFLKMEEKIGCFHPTSPVFDTPEEREKAKNMCEEIGYQLFFDKLDWSDDLKKERALGYGNSQKLIVFFYNVPTSTLPILWKRGWYCNKKWEPLFLRREKSGFVTL